MVRYVIGDAYSLDYLVAPPGASPLCEDQVLRSSTLAAMPTTDDSGLAVRQLGGTPTAASSSPTSRTRGHAATMPMLPGPAIRGPCLPPMTRARCHQVAVPAARGTGPGSCTAEMVRPSGSRLRSARGRRRRWDKAAPVLRLHHADSSSSRTVHHHRGNSRSNSNGRESRLRRHSISGRGAGPWSSAAGTSTAAGTACSGTSGDGAFAWSIGTEAGATARGCVPPEGDFSTSPARLEATELQVSLLTSPEFVEIF